MLEQEAGARRHIVALLSLFLKEARARTPSSSVASFHPAVLLLGQNDVVMEHDLPPALLASEGASPAFTGEILPVRKLQCLYAHWALEQLGGLKGKTAEKLGVDATTLAKWLHTTDEQ